MRTPLVRGLAVGCASALSLLVTTSAAAAPVPQLPERARAVETSSHAAVRAEGDFVAAVDFLSLQTRDVGRNRCEFRVDGTLTFTGTVEGVAEGTTTALIVAPCTEALATPPGTYADVFRFDGDFVGDVGGTPASGTLRYAGVTRVGGGIDALITLRADDARAVLRADAQVTVGGTYRGIAASGT